MRRRNSAFPTFASEAAREAALREAWWNKPISEDVQKWMKTWDTQDEQPAGEGTKGEEPTGEGQATRKNGWGSVEKGGNEEASGKFQLLCRADMVHYLDVRDGWEIEQCECFFDRAVSYRAQRALNMMSLEDFRFHLHTQLPPSVPAAAPNRKSRAIHEFASQIPVEMLGGRGGAPTNIQFHWKCKRAPFVCAEAMLLEWMAEPHVGVLMDLGRIRFRLPAIVGAGDASNEASTSSAPAAGPAAAAAVAPAVAWSSCWRCSSCWAAYRRAVSFAAFLALVARWPRFVTLWRAHMDSHDAFFPAPVGELGAGRQQEDDSFASVLVQVLGLKESGDLQEGFGVLMQNLLSGGLEKAYAEERGRGRAGGQDARGRGMGQMGHGGDTWWVGGGRVAREVVIFPQLGSPEESSGRDGGSGRGMEEELYGMMGSAWGGVRREEVTGMVSLDRGAAMDSFLSAVGGGGGGGGRGRRGVGNQGDAMLEWMGEGTEAEDGGSGGEWGGSGGEMVGEGAEGRDGEGGRDGKGEKWRENLKGSVWERTECRKKGQVFFLDGNNADKTRIEDAATERARKMLRRVVGGRGGRETVARVRGDDGMGGGGVADATADTTVTATAEAATTATNATAEVAAPNVPTKAAAADTPVNTNPVVAAFTYRAACILRWFRMYGSDFIPGKQCFKKNTQGKVRPMRHPLRDLPSLLVRLGAIPKPLDQSSIPLELEEWPRGDEAAGKLPKDPSERCFCPGIVKESGLREEGGGKASKQANPGGRQGGTTRAMRGRGGRGGGRRGGRGGGNRGVDRGVDGVDWGSGSGVGRGATHGDDSPSFAEALEASVAPQNKKIPIVRCTADAKFLVDFAEHMVLPPSCSHCSKCFSTFTYYLPALTLIATFAYQPASALFNRFVSVFPLHSPEFNDLERAEQLPVFFLLLVALKWPKAVLQIEELKGVGRDEESGEGNGEGCSGAGKATGKREAKSGRRGGRRDGGGEVVGECGEVWEEVRSWCLAAMVAWPASLRLVGAGLGKPCEGSKHLGEGETRWGPKMWERAVEMRYQEDQEKWGGAGGGIRAGAAGGAAAGTAVAVGVVGGVGVVVRGRARKRRSQLT
ncbi:unnamed protein product [Closterium sp. Naga37s-1]|nr:unnamed protein product [Closterium sp. Naga37s-1]